MQKKLSQFDIIFLVKFSSYFTAKIVLITIFHEIA